ncbi:MAG TPA: amidase [Candidatus Dormibacteraeota bacterium]|jgi:amidase
MSGPPPVSASGAKGGAFVRHNLQSPVRGALDGPLSGFAAVVKDAFDIAGERTGAGSPEWLAAGNPATATATAVRQVLDAGATIVGKTVCDEFLYSVTGANAHYGTPLNPRAPDRLPGGSSSGSASATAAGACDFALGTDTGGSVRVPAALCGVFGIRTSHGRVDIGGVLPMAPSFDSVGWFAPSAGVLRRVGGVLLGGRSVVAGIDRVVIATDLVAAADPDVQAPVERFVARARDHVPPPEEVDLSQGAITDWIECFRVIQGYETWQTFGDWITAHRPRLGPGIEERMRYASTVTAGDADRARERRVRIRARLDDVITPGTVVIMPTVPSPAPRLDTSAGDLNQFRGRTMAFTCIAGLGGLPQVSLPVGLGGGAPVAVSLLAWAGGDEAMLDLAAGLAASLTG